MSNYLKCKVCGEPCDPKQTTQTNPLCPEHEQKHLQGEKFISAGGGQDPETAKEE